MDSSRVSDEILSFVDSMRDSSGLGFSYKLFKGAEVNPFASCFALYLRYLLGDLEKLSNSEKEEWIIYLKSFQDPETGLFSDPEAANRVVDERHDSIHLDRQFTTFCISALGCLNSKADYPLKFLEDFYDEEYFSNWINNLDWSNSSNSGNKVMFIAICAIYNFEKFGDEYSKALIENWFDWMDDNQDPVTGFWGTSKNTQYFNGILGFYHQFLIYNYLERDVRYPERIVDRCLFLQLPDGGFNPEYGGASCDDIDAIHTLVYLYHKFDYRRSDIESALRKTKKMILKNQNKDHGFCWSKHNWYDYHRYLDILKNSIKKKDIFYSYLCLRGLARGQKKDLIKQKVTTGWSTIHREESESSLFDTWFRCSTITLIETVITEEVILPGANLLKSPGLGWFDIEKVKRV